MTSAAARRVRFRRAFDFRACFPRAALQPEAVRLGVEAADDGAVLLLGPRRRAAPRLEGPHEEV